MPHVAHLWGISALIIGMLSAIGLLVCERDPYASGDPLTAKQQKSLWPTSPGEAWRYRRNVWGFWASVIALPIACILGIMDLLRA